MPLVVATALLTVSLFDWTLTIRLGVVTTSALEVGLLGVFLVLLLWSLASLIRWLRRDPLRGLVPVVLNLLVAGTLVRVPFSEVSRTLDFNLYLAQRAQVVSLVRSGALRPNVSYNPYLIRLPRVYAALSQGGEIEVDASGHAAEVLFFATRGAVDSFSGYVYRSDDRTPPTMAFGGTFTVMRKLRPHWFWGEAQ